MKFIIGILASFLLVACSFKGQQTKEEAPQIVKNTNSVELPIDLTLDSDGDMIPDVEEIKLGRNPAIADLPDLKVRFLQNYAITGTYTARGAPVWEQKVSIDTKVGSNDPDFKYRVGRIFVRDNAYQSAASVGRFSGHTEGVIEEHDYSWIKYPEVDSKFFHKKAIELSDAFTEYADFQEFSVTLESSVQLLPNRNFDSITNLEVSFYFYDYEKESYELLATKKVERHFNAGITETFQVTLDNAPQKLIRDNYLKKGEFIISKISDYEIPSLKTTYKQLLKSVREKTIPVAINTPLESTVTYVAVAEKGKRFSEILSTLFDKGFKIEGDKLLKIGQFENNLPSFTYLKEIEDKDKLGNWYIFSNKLRESYLDHAFIKGDYLTLSYITGSELASQSSEKIYSRKMSFDGGDDSFLVPIGNVSPNSKISIQVKGLFANGTILDRKQEVIDTQDQSCGRNCISFGRLCRWDVVTPLHYSKPPIFNEDFSGDIEKLSLVINDVEYSLKELFKEENGKRRISLKFEKSDLFLEITDISKIAPVTNFEENILYFKVKTHTEHSFYGIKLIEVGRVWDGVGGCPFITPGMALDKGLPIASESIYLDKIQYAHKNAIRPEFQSKIIYSKTTDFRSRLLLSVSSSINNYFN